MKNSMEVTKNIKKKTTIWSSNSSFGYLSEENENMDLEKIHTPPGSLQHHSQWPGYGNSLSVHLWMNESKDCGAHADRHTLKYYSAIKKNEILSSVITWMDI